MSCKYVCDGCGTELHAELASFQPALLVRLKALAKEGMHVPMSPYRKPTGWLQRFLNDRCFDVCSADCARQINARTGQHAKIPNRGGDGVAQNQDSGGP